jgi:drug/metabolite transporter (DMT)-like permease
MTEDRKGELLIFAAGGMWAFFPIITILSYSNLSGLSSLAWSTVFAAIFLGALVLYRGKGRELLDLRIWKYGLFIALFIGVLFYSFMFVGLESTTAGNAAIIGLFEVFTSYLLFNWWRREAYSFEHVAGSLLMMLGALIVLGRDFSGFNVGDCFIIAATLFSPVGNMFQQKARAVASSETIMFVRSVLSVPALFLLALALGKTASASSVYASVVFLMINGILLLGLSKILWIEAIHRISVTKSVALSSLNPLLTLLLALPILGQAPNIWQFAAFIPFFFGVLLLTDNLRFRRSA